MTSSSPDFAEHLSRASLWVRDHAPAELQADLRAILEHQRENGGPGALDLWLKLSYEMQVQGYLDPSAAVCFEGLSLDPDLHVLRLRLADLYIQIGDKAAAQSLLTRLPMVPPLRAQAVSLLLRNKMVFDKDRRNELITDWSNDLMALPAWVEDHNKLISYLRGQGLVDYAVRLLMSWMQSKGPNLDLLAHLGQILLEDGQIAAAENIFRNIWQSFAEQFRPIAGDYDGTIAPYDDEVEAGIKAKIDAAFAAPERPPLELPQDRPLAELRDKRVLYVGIELINNLFPNDMAAHFQGSAAEAGVRVDLHLDSGIVFPYEFRGSDEEVAARVAKFESRVAEERPDVVFLDACYFPQKRGLNPELMQSLKRKYGFKLVCMMRDALMGCETIVRSWLPPADVMILHDPLSPVVELQPLQEQAKVIVLPIPSLYHAPKTADVEHDLGLTFVGSVNFRVRLMFLSVLLNVGIDFTALYGENRAAQTPDLDAYFHWLARSKAILNFSAHSPTEHLMTGRVWETITVGAVLLEQNNPNTECMLTPWRHYLPWSSVADIVHLWKFLERHDEYRARIVDAAFAYATKHYNSERVWTAILGRAFKQG